MKFDNNKELKVGDWITIKPKQFWDELFGNNQSIKVDGLAMDKWIREDYFGKRLQINNIRISRTNEVVYELKGDKHTCGWTKRMIE